VEIFVVAPHQELFAIQLVAQAPAGEGKGGDQPANPFNNFLFPLIGFGLLMYFMLIRPARRQEKERQTMVDALKRDDEVVTSGGIIGTVINVKKDKDEVTIESGGTRLKVLKSSVARVVAKSDRAEEPAGDSESKEDKED
jgi:preprotein translocase subunit YajC